MNITKKIKKFFEDPNLPCEEMTSEQFSSIIPDYHQNQLVMDGEVDCNVIACSDSTFLVSAAARICVGMDPEYDYEKRLKHISRVVGRGHESTLEHTNIVMMLTFTNSVYEQFVLFVQSLKYLNCKIRKEDEYTYVLLGGSIRGYKHIFRTCPDVQHNKFAYAIKNALYATTESVFYNDLIEDGIMNKESFAQVADGIKKVAYKRISNGEDVCCEELGSDHPLIKKGTAWVYTQEHQKILDIYNKVKKFGFTLNDCMDMAVVTVIFTGISRPISMQINRHRNGISQESQRYVDYSGKGFVDPMGFIDDDNQSIKKKFKIQLFDSKEPIEMTSKQIGSELCKIYKQLTIQGMLKQDARSFLPANVVTKEMVTFTYRNLYHFLVMREDVAAQNEIRETAKNLHSAIDEYDLFCSKHSDELLNLESMTEYELEKRRNIKANGDIDEIEGEAKEYEEDIKPIE